MRATATLVMPAGCRKSKSQGLYSIKARDNVQHFHFFMNSLDLPKEKLSPLLALWTWKEKLLLASDGENDAREVSDDACVWLAGHCQLSTHTYTLRITRMTLVDVSQKYMLKQFFFVFAELNVFQTK